MKGLKFLEIVNDFNKYLLNDDGYIKDCIITNHLTRYVLDSESDEHTTVHKGLEISFIYESENRYRLISVFVEDIEVLEKHFILKLSEVKDTACISVSLDKSISDDVIKIYDISSVRSTKYRFPDKKKVVSFVSLTDGDNCEIIIFNDCICRMVENGITLENKYFEQCFK